MEILNCSICNRSFTDLDFKFCPLCSKELETKEFVESSETDRTINSMRGKFKAEFKRIRSDMQKVEEQIKKDYNDLIQQNSEDFKAMQDSLAKAFRGETEE